FYRLKVIAVPASARTVCMAGCRDFHDYIVFTEMLCFSKDGLKQFQPIPFLRIVASMASELWWNHGLNSLRPSSTTARRTFFKLRNLEVGVQYFLQVEAQSLCGKKRLIGSKAGKVLNVTDLSSSSEYF
ncbi:unnamed protein product, partial [Nesidiocoris tenuis]